MIRTGLVVGALLLLPSVATAKSLAPTRAAPPQAGPGEGVNLMAAEGMHGGVAFKIEGAACESGKPPAENANAEPDRVHYEACNSRLVQPAAVLNFPGVIFFGGAFGDKASKFVIAPGVAVGAGGTVPIIKPSLNWWVKDGKYLFTLPDTVRFNMNFIGSLTGSLGGLIFPSGSQNASGASSTSTEVGYSVGIFSAIEFAWTSWDTQLQFDGNGNVTEVKGSGQMKTKIALSLGLLLGYLGNSDTVGHAFIIGVQPGISFKF